MWRKGNSLTLLVGLQMDTTTMENSMEISLKKKQKNTRNKATVQLSKTATGHLTLENQN